MTQPVTPVLTIDAIITDPIQGIVLIRRGHPPFAGYWALPGGFVEVGESCEQACCREAKEETGLAVEIINLAGVYSHPDRDPRGHTVSVIYICRVIAGSLRAGDDASQVSWFADLRQVSLAFDHREILSSHGFIPVKIAT